MKKSRGKLLTTFLVIESILVILYLYVANMPLFLEVSRETYSFVPSWYNSFSMLSILVDIVALIGIWAWKKTAVYAYVISQALVILAEVFVLKPNPSDMGYVSFGLAMTILFLYAISRKWKYFS